jgi:hypothetical protein
MKLFGVNLPRLNKTPVWVAVLLGVLLVVALVLTQGGDTVMANCPGSQVYCPGVGCVSGKDKCVPGAVGGPSRVFSKETFVAECKSMKACPGGTRTDGPCLME